MLKICTLLAAIAGVLATLAQFRTLIDYLGHGVSLANIFVDPRDVNIITQILFFAMSTLFFFALYFRQQK
jgi:hypothetical protein